MAAAQIALVYIHGHGDRVQRILSMVFFDIQLSCIDLCDTTVRVLAVNKLDIRVAIWIAMDIHDIANGNIGSEITHL